MQRHTGVYVMMDSTLALHIRPFPLISTLRHCVPFDAIERSGLPLDLVLASTNAARWLEQHSCERQSRSRVSRDPDGLLQSRPLTRAFWHPLPPPLSRASHNLVLCPSRPLDASGSTDSLQHRLKDAFALGAPIKEYEW